MCGGGGEGQGVLDSPASSSDCTFPALSCLLRNPPPTTLQAQPSWPPTHMALAYVLLTLQACRVKICSTWRQISASVRRTQSVFLWWGRPKTTRGPRSCYLIDFPSPAGSRWYDPENPEHPRAFSELEPPFCLYSFPLPPPTWHTAKPP